MLNIEIKNLDEFLNKVSKINIQRTLNIWVKKSIIFLEWAAKKETPVDTWLLRNSYETFFESLKWKLVNTRKYWLYVHEWTRYIKWNPFLTRAAKKSNKDINIIFSNEVHKTLNSLKT
mgnify:CR=1 FL=1